MNYENLEGKDGTFENSPGMEQTFYFIPASDMESMAAAKYFSEINAVGDAAMVGIIGEDHVTKPFKRWFSMKLLLASGNIAGEMIGERGSRSVQTVLEGFLIESTALTFGAQRVMKEGEYIVLAPHADGTMHQIGRMNKPALITMNTNSGQQGESAKGAEVRIEANDVSGWIYEGAFNVEPLHQIGNALKLDGTSNGMAAHVFDASGDFSFGLWLRMTGVVNERHVLIASDTLEIGIAVQTIFSGSAELGDVYLKHNGGVIILGSVYDYFYNALQLAFEKVGSSLHFYKNGLFSNAVDVSAVGFSAFTYLFGGGVNSYFQGLIGEFYFHSHLGAVAIDNWYNYRASADLLQIVPNVDYYYTFNDVSNNDTQITNDGDLGGSFNVAPAVIEFFDIDDVYIFEMQDSNELVLEDGDNLII